MEEKFTSPTKKNKQKPIPELKFYEVPIKELLLKFIPTLSSALKSNSKQEIVNAFLVFTSQLIDLQLQIKTQQQKDINLVTLGDKLNRDIEVQTALNDILPFQQSIRALMEACTDYNAETVDARLDSEPNTLPENALMLASLRGALNLIYNAFTTQLFEQLEESEKEKFKKELSKIPIDSLNLTVTLGKDIPSETQLRMFQALNSTLSRNYSMLGTVIPSPLLITPERLTTSSNSEHDSSSLASGVHPVKVWDVIRWIIFAPLTLGEGVLRCTDWLGNKVNNSEFAPIAKFVSKFFKFFFWPDKLIEEYQAYSGLIRVANIVAWTLIALAFPPLFAKAGLAIAVDFLPSAFLALEPVGISALQLLSMLTVCVYAAVYNVVHWWGRGEGSDLKEPVLRVSAYSSLLTPTLSRGVFEDQKGLANQPSSAEKADNQPFSPKELGNRHKLRPISLKFNYKSQSQSQSSPSDERNNSVLDSKMTRSPSSSGEA